MIVYVDTHMKKRKSRYMKEKQFKPMKVSLSTYSVDPERDHRTIPSLGDGIGNAVVNEGKKYDNPDMAEREKKAREVKHTIAPICNKGGYQLITNESDMKTMGRKV